MSMTPLHMSVGIAIAKLIPNPWIAIPLAFLSHFFLDLYPEWYPKQGPSKQEVRDSFLGKFSISKYCEIIKKILQPFGWKEKTLIIVEFLFGLFVIFSLFHTNSWLMVACAIAANFQDITEFLYGLFSKGEKFWFCHTNKLFSFKLNWFSHSPAFNPLQNLFLDLVFGGLLVLVSCF
jgi:hypothetical protein